MSKFTGPLTITEVNAKLELWRLEEDLCYFLVYNQEDGEVTKQLEIKVPKGYVSDGASVPWVLEKLLPRWGKYRRPAILHDFLCSKIKLNKPHIFAPDRKSADKVFLDSMKVVGVGIFTRYLLYVGCRLGAILGPLFPKFLLRSVRNEEYDKEL